MVQAILRLSKMDMNLYYSHSRRQAKSAAQEKVLHRLVPQRQRKSGSRCGSRRQFSEAYANRELVC